MKKCLCIAGIIFIMMYSIVYAGEYQEYLNEDKNYPLCTAHMGHAQYVNLNTVDVVYYHPPQYIISADIISVDSDKDNRIDWVRNVNFKYDYHTKKMYSSTDKSKKWDFIPHNGAYYQSSWQKAGEILFHHVYKISFYD